MLTITQTLAIYTQGLFEYVKSHGYNCYISHDQEITLWAGPVGCLTIKISTTENGWLIWETAKMFANQFVSTTIPYEAPMSHIIKLINNYIVKIFATELHHIDLNKHIVTPIE